MSARMQFVRKREHVLAETAELRMGDVLANQENSQSPPCQLSLLTPRAHCRREDAEKLCSQFGDPCQREEGAFAGIGGRGLDNHAESLHDPSGGNSQSRCARVVTY